MNKFDNDIKALLADKYDVLKLIGKGGMANVYKAIQLGLDRKVAIKMIHSNLVHDPEMVKRFRLEAKSAARLNHPNIITIFDVDERENIIFIILEYLDGVDLSELITNRKRLRTDEVVDIMIPISSALAEIHSKGLIHRDIKSSNIFATRQGRPVLMDFGIAALKESSSGITRPGSVIGTPEYMSPEQANGEVLGPESDIYSLGIVMYQCLSGAVPFAGESPISTIIQISQGNIPELDRHSLEVPEWLHNIVLKCLAKNPQDRFRTAQDLMESLSKRKIVVTQESKATQVVALNYDEDIEKLKGAINQAATIDEKLKVLEGSPATLKEIFNIEDEIQILKDAREEKDAFNQEVDDDESYFEEARKAVINQKFADINEQHEAIVDSFKLPFHSPIREMSAPLFLHYLARFNSHLEIMRSNVEDLKKTLRASKVTVMMLDKLYQVLPFLSLSESEEQKVNKKLIGTFDELNHVLIELFKSESWGRTERKVIFYNLSSYLEDQELKLPQKDDLFKLLVELHNKHLYPNSKLFHKELSQAEAEEPVEEKAKAKAAPKAKVEKPQEKEALLSFDSAYNHFIRQELVPHAMTKELMSMSEEEIKKNSPPRLLYLFFSPKRKGNALALLQERMRILKSAFGAAKSMRSDMPFIYEGERSVLDDFSTYDSLHTDEGKKQWDEQLKEHLKKVKANMQKEDEGIGSAVLMQNFNFILEQLKPYLLKTLLQDIK